MKIIKTQNIRTICDKFMKMMYYLFRLYWYTGKLFVYKLQDIYNIKKVTSNVKKNLALKLNIIYL